MTAIQRFGGALNLHVPFHTLALDGVFARGADNVPGFYPQPPPTDAEVATVLRTIRRCMTYPGSMSDPTGPCT